MNHLSIQAKLTGSFVIVIAFLLFLGSYSLYSMATINDKTAEITENWMGGINVLNEISSESSLIRRYEYNHLVSTDAAKMTANEKVIQEAAAKIDRSIRDYNGLIDNTAYNSPEEKAKDQGAIDNIAKLWQAYRADVETLMALSREHRQQEGFDFI